MGVFCFYNIMKNIIKNIAREIAEEKGIFLINTIAKGSNKNPNFEVYIDSKEGITAGDCVKFTREIREELEATDFADVNYSLVVSSPGIDEPIKYLDQYNKHISREFKLSYDDGENIQSIEAKLLKIVDDNLYFAYKDEEIEVNFNKIKKAKVKISF